MRIFAIGDLHLSGTKHKEMDIFGQAWENHAERIMLNWQAVVKENDIVLIPGDISWATRLEDAVPDLQWLGELPGRKILIRGNHDYWWASPTKVREVLPRNVQIIQNDALEMEGTVFCGTRGWLFPAGTVLDQDDLRIFEREKIRLRLSLDKAKVLGGSRLVVMMHYPPLYEHYPCTDFVEILEEYTPDLVVFGHLHGRILDQINLNSFYRNGIEYKLVSADYVHFRPVLLYDTSLGSAI